MRGRIPSIAVPGTLALAIILALTSVGAPVAAARADEPPAAGQRKYLLERVDDAAVVQLYADGFKALPLKEKLLVWHLYHAAIAGRDIYYDQRYGPSLRMRALVE